MSKENQKPEELRVRNRLKVLLAEREIKFRKKISQIDLAEATGISANTISSWMKQKPMGKIDGYVLEKLCDFLECQIGDLLFMDEKKS